VLDPPATVVWRVGILSTMGSQRMEKAPRDLVVLLKLRKSRPEMSTSRTILYVREVQIFNVSDVAKALRVPFERIIIIESKINLCMKILRATYFPVHFA